MRNRLTRGIPCGYLEAIGVDPEGTFERRELDDPIVFTTDHPGVPCARHVEQGERYRKFRKEKMFGLD